MRQSTLLTLMVEMYLEAELQDGGAIRFFLVVEHFSGRFEDVHKWWLCLVLGFHRGGCGFLHLLGK